MNSNQPKKLKKLSIGIFYPDIDDPGGYSRDILRLFNELCENKDIKVHKLKNIKQLINSGKELDVIHIFGVFSHSVVLAGLYCWLISNPFIITTFSHLMPFAMAKGNRKKKSFLNFIGKFILNKARRIHVFTKFEEKELRNLGIKTPVTKILLGIYPEDLQAMGSNIDSKISSIKRPFIAFLGRLDIYQKGIDILIDGFEKYLKTNSKYRLIICGQDWQGGKTFVENKLEELGNPDQISFLGAVSEDEKNWIIENSEAFVYPSRFDGPPRPLRFALVKKKKILASYQSNIGDNIEEKGWGLLFDANAEAISSVLSEFEKKTDWAEYENPSKSLAWDILTLEYVALYQAIIL